MTADVVPRMEAASPALNLPSAAKLRPSPAVPGSMESAIKMWLQVGNVQKLQQAVLDGYGWLLKDQSSRLPHVNKFLKKVPDYQEKIDTIHEQVIRGDFRSVRQLLDKKGWANARDHYGHSPLHKSVMANQEEIMRFILESYPDHAEDRDNEGRTPLHYAAALQGTTNGTNQLYSILVEAGADENVVDVQGHTPSFYRDHPQDIRHRTIQSRKPPPLQTRLMKADPDSATSPSKYSQGGSDIAASAHSDSDSEAQTSAKKRPVRAKKKGLLPSVSSRANLNNTVDTEQPPPVPSGGIVISKKDKDTAEKVLKGQAAISRGIINKDIQTFLHKSKSAFHIEDVKHAMDNARIIARSESTSEFEPSSPTSKKSVALKWKALALKAQAQRGDLEELENVPENSRKRSELEQVKRLIKGPSGAAAASNAVAQASIASMGGGGDGSSSNKWKKLLNANPRPEGDPDDSAKRLALLRDARKVKGNKASQLYQDEDEGQDIGQRLNKKTRRLEDALPLVPKHLKKSIVGAKDYPNFDKEFYKHFRYIFVDIPEPDEDFPSESTHSSLPAS